jgi:uncharacterized phage protein (TIGR02218 family)
MTYENRETSVESGKPVELYHFTIGTTHYYYTSAPDTFLFGGNNWVPRQIERTDPSQSTEDRRQQMEVTLPTEDPVASRFVGIIPGSLMTLEISRYHRDDTGVFILWSGAVVGASYGLQGAQCTLRCVTSEAAFSRAIPRYKYQGLCNNVLFDDLCQVTKASFTHTDTCTDVTGSDITVQNLATTFPTANWAVGGYASFNDSDFRLVMAQTSDVLTLFIPFENSPLGQTVKVFAGCDHLIATCKDKFSNLINFGGYPYVPTVNPFIVGVD